MLTFTSENVLSPLAETVTAILLHIEETNNKNLPLADLSKVASNVQDQLSNLIKVGTSIQESILNNQIFYDRFSEAIHKLKKSLSDLDVSINKLQKEGRDSEAKEVLKSSMRDLLEGTAQLLNCNDEFEISHIIESGEKSLTYLAKIKETNDVSTFAQLVKPTCQEFVDLISYTKSRASELLDERIKVDLEDYSEKISKEAPILISSMKCYLSNTSSESNRSLKDSWIQALQDSIVAILKIVKGEEENDNESDKDKTNKLWDFMDMKEKLALAIQYYKMGKVSDAKSVLEKIESDIVSAEQIINQIPLLAGNETVLRGISKAKKDISSIISLISESNSEESDNLNTEKQFSDINNFFLELDKETKQTIAGPVRKAFDAFKKSENLLFYDKNKGNIDEMLTTIESKSPEDAKAIFANFQNAAENILNAGEIISHQNVYSQNEIQNYHRKSLWAYKNLNSAFTSCLSSKTENSNDFKQKFVKEYVRDVFKTYLPVIQEYSELLMECTTPLDKENIKNKSDNDNSLMMNSLVEALPQSDHKLKKDVHAQEFTETKVNEEKGSNDEKFETNGGTEYLLVKEEQPKLLSQEEAIKNPIKAVAQELFVAASNWSEENNPLIRTTNDLGKHIENLSETYRDSTFKANLIETTKKIVLLTQSIIDYALYIAEHCSDPKLQKHLVEIVERLPTIGVQLKIVCAVKASRPNDLDTETQIITCAKNIMRTVKDTISACESAYLRYTSEPVASHPKLMTLKNKRITKDQNLITDFADLKFVRKIYKIK